MLNAYILIIDIISTTTEEESFRAQVEPSLAHLRVLKGAFDRSPCTVQYYPPADQDDTSGWSVRGVVMISLGKERAGYLMHLYQSIAHLIALELPHLHVKAETSTFQSK